MVKSGQGQTDGMGPETPECGRFQAVLDSMEDAICIVGPGFRIEFGNLALRNLMGNGEGQICHEFFGHDPSICERCRHEMSSFGPDLRREWHWPEKERFYEIVVSPLHAPDGDISRLHVLRDITERKRLEAQLRRHSGRLETKIAEQAEMLLQKERLALLGEISAGLAHEIRTPLAAIITGIKLIEKGCEQTADSELVFNLLKCETARLERKVQEFLSYAKPRLPQLQQTSIESLFAGIRSILTADHQLLGNVAITLEVKPPTLTWPLDADRMKEALLNICVNALQALGGNGMLRLEARSYYAGVLELLVRDNGPGISRSVLPHIFKPFYTGRSDGTGLGLAISKDIIEHHRGHITVTSIPNLHTTFRITLRRPILPQDW
jgi:two-component system, NtrC family, sensor histidine kinase HydH